MKTIINSSDQDVSVIHKGVSYTVLAGGTLQVSEETAIFWIGVHGFLTVASETAKAVKEVVEEKEVEVPVEKTTKKKTVKKSK